MPWTLKGMNTTWSCSVLLLPFIEEFRAIVRTGNQTLTHFLAQCFCVAALYLQGGTSISLFSYFYFPSFHSSRHFPDIELQFSREIENSKGFKIIKCPVKVVFTCHLIQIFRASAESGTVSYAILNLYSLLKQDLH